MRSLIIMLLVLCTAACASTGKSNAIGFTNPLYTVSSVLHDFESKKLHEHDYVSVSGYLTFGDDKHNLWFSVDNYEYIRYNMPDITDPAWKKCIALGSYGKFRNNLLKNNGNNVIISGYIYRRVPQSSEVNLGSCNEILISMDGPGARVVRIGK
jgi:hypothetical protein